VANVQNTALLVSAFALNRGDLLRAAMQDRIHQPYRMEACPLLPRLLSLNGTPGVLGVALSGAGPSVLVIAEEAAEGLAAAIRKWGNYGSAIGQEGAQAGNFQGVTTKLPKISLPFSTSFVP
jgi:homoserine kinase